MPYIQIDISEEHKDLIKSVYLEREAKLLSELKEVQSVIKKLNTNENVTYPDGYSPKWTWKEKIYFILNNERTALTTTEIVDRFLQIEPGLDRRLVSGSISATLSNHTGNNGAFTKDINLNNEYYYSINIFPPSISLDEESTIKGSRIFATKEQVEAKRKKKINLDDILAIQPNDDDLGDL